MSLLSGPRISLCMIVRDEAPMMPRFLEATAGTFDELCVVDTGSIDQTVELLSAAGAKVQSMPWRDDFSAARNASLAMATGDWVLILDADELPGPGFAQAFRAAAAGASVGALTVLMRNALPHGHVRLSRLLRAFRRDAQIQYTHRIHEDASASVRQMLAARGLTSGSVDVVIEHLGYERERATAKNKKQRDHRLLEAAISDDPHDWYAWLKWLELARYWRDGAMLSKVAAQALAALERSEGAGLMQVPQGGDLVAALAEVCFSDEPRAALNFVGWWRDRVAPSTVLSLKEGEWRERLGDLPAAKTAFEQCLRTRDPLGDLQLSTVRPMLGLARLALAAQDRPRAAQWVDRALQWAPADPEALLAALVIARWRHGEPGVQYWVKQHRLRHGDLPELHRALGDEALVRGRLNEAVRAWRRSQRRVNDSHVALQLAQASVARGEIDEARRAIAGLAGRLPEAQLGVLLCDLIEGRNSDLNLELEPRDAERALQDWVSLVLRYGAPAVQQRLMASWPAVGDLFPRVNELVWQSMARAAPHQEAP